MILSPGCFPDAKMHLSVPSSQVLVSFPVMEKQSGAVVSGVHRGLRIYGFALCFVGKVTQTFHASIFLCTILPCKVVVRTE